MSTGWSLVTPAALLLLPPLLLWLLLALRRGHRLPSPAAILALLACGLLLVLAAAGPRGGWRQTSSAVALLLDVSPSIPAGVRAAAVRQAEALAATAGPGAEVHRLAFAREAVALPDAAALATAAAAGREGPTDLRSALAAARALLPQGGRVLLLSDGQHSLVAASVGTATALPDPSLQEEAAALPRHGLTLHALPLWPAAAPDVAVERLIAPAQATARSTVPVTVMVSCRGQIEPADQRIELGVEGQPQVQSLLLPTPCDGMSRPLQALVELPAAGHPLIEARRAGAGVDLIADDDRAGTTVQVAGPAAILWLGDERQAHPLRELLEQDGHQLTRRLPERLAAAAGELSAYQLVVLDDVAAPRLVPGEEEALEGYVRGGGGLLVLGGPDSFGAGGYAGTRLDALLPLSADLRRTGGRMAVVLLVDKSGSMGGNEQGWERLLLAKETLRALLLTLGRPDDEVAILGFDTRPVVLLPRTRLQGLDLEGIDTGAIQAGGGTDPTPAIEEAALELQSSQAAVRQIIAITDGRFAGPDVEPAIRGLVRRGIRFSTIGVGATAEMARLERLATLGQGGISRVLEPRHLPRAVLRELLQARGGVIRQGPVAIEPGSGLASDLHLDLPLPVPPLDALDRTLPREGSSRWLQTAAGEPVLAAIRRDAGLAIAFAAAPGRWTTSWSRWPGQAPLWRGVLDLAAR
ncbi:MAG: VWA domain-containing protein, partial [Deltaproteobacteria bacterium]|nr:VWA domain-containing protein [Deltaproteobacteria bacterium]